MKGHSGEGASGLLNWRKFGSKLLHFAEDERNLDQDALYRIWTEADGLCWADTEQEAHRARGHSVRTSPSLPAAEVPNVAAVVDDDVASPITRWPEDMRGFESEIEQWRVQRKGAGPNGALRGRDEGPCSKKR